MGTSTIKASGEGGVHPTPGSRTPAIPNLLPSIATSGDIHCGQFTDPPDSTTIAAAWHWWRWLILANWVNGYLHSSFSWSWARLLCGNGQQRGRKNEDATVDDDDNDGDDTPFVYYWYCVATHDVIVLMDHLQMPLA